MNTTVLAIAVLSHAGYDVFVEIAEGGRIVALVKGECLLCIVRPATSTDSNSPILRLGKVPLATRVIVAVCADTKEVWTIPFEDVSEMTCIRLGKRWEKYRVRVEITTDLNLPSDDESLKTAAKKAAKIVKE